MSFVEFLVAIAVLVVVGWAMTLIKIEALVRRVIHVLIVIYAVILVLCVLGVVHMPHIRLR